SPQNKVPQDSREASGREARFGIIAKKVDRDIVEVCMLRGERTAKNPALLLQELRSVQFECGDVGKLRQAQGPAIETNPEQDDLLRSSPDRVANPVVDKSRARDPR